MDTISQIINWFGLIYIGIPLGTLTFIIIYLLLGRKISKENLEKIIEFSKWYIISVAIVFTAKIIDTGFSERETGIKEMQVYDKYVSTILEADNIEARWKLAEYFSTVTPTDRLRERWIVYKKTIEPDYLKFKDLDSTENEYLSQDTLTPSDKEALNLLQREKAAFEGKLVEKKMGRWVIVFTGDSNLKQSRHELNKLIEAGIDNPRIYFRNNSYRTISKIFSNKQEANNYFDLFKHKIRKDAYIVDLDKWCPNEILRDGYYGCQ